MPFSELTTRPLRPESLEMDGISKRTMEEHFKLYQGYVNKFNEITKKLRDVDMSTANQTYSDLRELKLELSFAIGGVKNHELYFSLLGGKGGEPGGALRRMIDRDFGAYGKFHDDMKQTGIGARGWVWLAYDYDAKCLFNYLGDAQNTYPIWNAVPIVALDTYEHAYWIDYGSARGPYIDAFFKNIDWSVAEERFERLVH